MLAVHGVHLFKQRLGVDTEVEAARVVRELLPSPLTTRILEANDRDLPTYAEAAPAEFLSILERDLKSDAPAVFGLLRPVDSGIFGSHPSRNGLLWALEGLSWSAETLPRAAFILARLAQIEINDNWANKPAHSLELIFRSWMPQTAGSHEERVACIKKLAEDYPNVGWKICVVQFGDDVGMGGYSYKPRWRRDGFGFGNPFPTWEPVLDFQCEMVEMALRWKEHTLSTLSDLVVRLHALDDAYQARVWALIETWANANADDAEKATLREKIRVTALSQRAQQNARVAALGEKARAAYAALEPRDLLNKHAWLFRDIWVEESADEIEEIDDFDFQNRDERIHKLRVAAMHEIRDARGLAGLLELAEHGKASSQIGVLAAHDLLSEQELQELLRLALRSMLEDGKGAYSYKNIIGGAVRAISEDDKRERILKAVAADLAEEDTARLLMLASFARNTWVLVDELSEAAQARYWRDVVPDWIRYSDEETNEAVERLLKAGRPRAAFSCVRLHPGKVDAQVLFRLLSEMTVEGNDKSGEYMLEHYDVERAFKCIDASPALTLDQKARLEFAYLDALARPRGNRATGYGIPNLERYIEAHPEVYVQAIVWLYMRKDGGADPAEFQAPQDRMKTMADRGYQLLEAVVRMPGHDDLGELKADRLAKWVTSVRQTCSELSRAEIADRCLGKLLAHARVGKDGVWPCEPVRQVMEEIQSESIMQGAHTGVYNSRGVHWRGEGGDQERELAEKYRKWGLALQLSHPYVSAKLLMELAKTYEREATREDTEAGIRRRLR